MEFTNYLNVDTIVTFAIAILLIELWINFTKELPIIKRIPTKIYTWMIAVLHLCIINTSLILFPLSLIGVYTLLCNALIIAVILCGGYDVVTGKITINQK
ncbi:MAG: hypothetical protein RR891_12705 [Clostridium sp.]|uniref:hypothetical protein n=1 Tax=Clostridium sp. TaxID=1506 RepID=UPI0030706380